MAAIRNAWNNFKAILVWQSTQRQTQAISENTSALKINSNTYLNS